MSGQRRGKMEDVRCKNARMEEWKNGNKKRAKLLPHVDIVIKEIKRIQE